jgi:hypothetical protein
MPRVGQFDTDRSAVHVGYAVPKTFARMPGALVFINQLDHAAVLIDHVMGAELRHWITDGFKPGFGRFHARVVQHDVPQGHRRIAFVKIGRGARPYVERHFIPRCLHTAA